MIDTDARAARSLTQSYLDEVARREEEEHKRTHAPDYLDQARVTRAIREKAARGHSRVVVHITNESTVEALKAAGYSVTLANQTVFGPHDMQVSWEAP